MIMYFRPSSIRLAISISPLRVKSSTEPISRRYMRTGLVVRPNSESSVAAAASAASSSTSSAAVVVDFGVGEVVALFAEHDQVLEPRLARLGLGGRKLELGQLDAVLAAFRLA